MANLLRKATALTGKCHDITAEDADWGYVGFGLYKLALGESVAEATGDREAILVLVEGKAEITAAGHDFGEMGERMSVFERLPPIASMCPMIKTGRPQPPQNAPWPSAPRLAKGATARSGLALRASPSPHVAKAKTPVL